MDIKRVRRIAGEMQKEISMIIANGIKDPRVSPMASVTAVDLKNDLQFAKIYISVLGDDKEKQDTIDGLKSSIGFIKKELGERLKLRHIPDITIHLDESIERGIYMEKLISEVMKKDNENRKNDEWL